MGNTIVASIMSMAGLGLFFASVLAFANRKLKVKEDPKIFRIENALPGVNCGACGFTGCRQYAEALAGSEAAPDLCKAGGDGVISALSDILGIRIEKKIKKIAVVHCGADAPTRKKKAVYRGIQTCAAAQNIFGGENSCDYGCVGFGDCQVACPFGAITMRSGLPVVDKEKCTACGKCITACPRDIISVEERPTENILSVACNNPEKGGETRKVCTVGCIACGVCQRLTEGVFHIEDNLARVRYAEMTKIKNIEEVIKKCPTRCIKWSQ